MANHKSALFLSSVLILLFSLFPWLKADFLVFGVGSGQTCFDITKSFKLTTGLFDSINPNLNWDALF
ncbi:hypothetical protein IMY05_007G0092300 [Salix suchowensis]|nr:hypothetical protein IMY05_007G0092300 [Salix suchowensis]